MDLACEENPERSRGGEEGGESKSAFFFFFLISGGGFWRNFLLSLLGE